MPEGFFLTAGNEADMLRTKQVRKDTFTDEGSMDQATPPSGLPPGFPKPEPMPNQWFLQKVRDEQNLSLAVAAGSLTGLAGAAFWAFITARTNTHYSIIAIGVGFAVGWVMRKVGKGIDISFPIAAAVIALISVALGDLFASLALVADYNNISFFEALSGLDWDATVVLMKAGFSYVDLLFYAGAAYFAFRNAERLVQSGRSRGNATSMSGLSSGLASTLRTDTQRLRRNGALILLLLAVMPSAGLGIDLCPFHILTGVGCPLCGLSRSVSSLLHLEFALSLSYHPLGIAAAACLLYLVAFNRMPLARRYSEKQLLFTAAGVLAAVWLGRLLLGYAGV